MMNKFHPYHMVTLSPWPLAVSLILWTAMLQTVKMMSKGAIKNTMLMLLMMITTTSALWWLDTIKESKKEGEHQNKVSKGLKMGMVLFIMSEVMFFFSFFWSYFHTGMSPSLEVGQTWPPQEIKSFKPTNVPLLNTLILISSGVSVTWAHHSSVSNMMKNSIKGLAITCLLGVYFSTLQYVEYSQAQFNLSDSSYGTIFFMATGFHGIHVLIGTTFLTITMINMKKMGNSMSHHNSFEMAAWYWHFVDIVWLFLYLSVYWWGE